MSFNFLMFTEKVGCPDNHIKISDDSCIKFLTDSPVCSEGCSRYTAMEECEKSGGHLLDYLSPDQFQSFSKKIPLSKILLTSFISYFLQWELFRNPSTRVVSGGQGPRTSVRRRASSAGRSRTGPLTTWPRSSGSTRPATTWWASRPGTATSASTSGQATTRRKCCWTTRTAGTRWPSLYVNICQNNNSRTWRCDTTINLFVHLFEKFNWNKIHLFHQKYTCIKNKSIVFITLKA